MPVKVDITPPPPANSKQPGVTKSLLYNGSKFQGHQKSKGNSYEVEVVLQVSNKNKVRNIDKIRYLRKITNDCIRFLRIKTIVYILRSHTKSSKHVF